MQLVVIFWRHNRWDNSILSGKREFLRKKLISRTSIVPMYATAYTFGEYDDKALLEIVVVDDLIFYTNDEYPRWYMANNCVLGRLSVTIYDLSTVINDDCEEFVDSVVNRVAPRNVASILYAIHNTYSLDEEKMYFQTHQLDDRWDEIANLIRAQLY